MTGKTVLPYELKPFDDASLKATVAGWKKELSKHQTELMPSLHEGKLVWIQTHMNYQEPNGDSLAYGIFSHGSSQASAIVDIVYTKTGQKWLKMLDLTLSPSLDLAFNADAFDFHTISGVYAATIVGAIRLTETAHPSKITKLYGRSGTSLAFFKGFGAYMEQGSHGKNLTLKVSMEGRWLVFRQK